jgi:LDH2 family malate/lactate/ureidoglycolate dehydrogenase
MSKYVQVNRKAQRSYAERMQQKGYQKTTVWIPLDIKEELHKKASSEGTTIQDLIVQSLKQRIKDQ